MRRRLVSILSWTPLALCLLLCWVSIRGGLFGLNDGFARDVVRRDHLDWLHYGFRTRHAGIEIAWRRQVFRNAESFTQGVGGWETRTWDGGDLRLSFATDVYPRLERLGFRFGTPGLSSPNRRVASDWAVRIPWWTLALVMLALHGVVMLRGLRAQRGINWRRMGRCSACGYDLRASASRCPECGAPMRTPEADVAAFST